MKTIFLFIFIASVILIVGCDKKVNLCEETNELSIEPGIGVGLYKLGMTENQVTDRLCKNYSKKTEKALIGNDETTYYFIKNMSFIFRKNHLEEINVWGNFKGAFEDLGVDYEREDIETYGEVIQHNGEYRILDIPGISFGLESGDNGKYIKIFSY